MTEISFSGNLPHSLEDAFTAVAPDASIDLSQDGTYLFGKDGTDISYFAEVKNQEVTEFFCTDSSGTRIPTFKLTGHVGSETRCYICYVDSDGQKWGCHSSPCIYM